MASKFLLRENFSVCRRYADLEGEPTKKSTEVPDSDFDELEICCNLHENKVYVFF